MKYAVADYRISEESTEKLSALGFEVVKTPNAKSVHTAICGHPDVMLHKLDSGSAIAEPSVFEYFKERLKEINVIKGKSVLSERYPGDIAYNAARVGNNLICGEKFTDPLIKEYATKNGVRIIDTKQGYAKCSVCVVGDNELITADKNIAKVAAKNNIRVLLIPEGNVELNGFNYGFIGGASGLLNRGLLAFNGDILTHAGGKQIVDFCESCKTEVISLKRGALYDVGSIITF